MWDPVGPIFSMVFLTYSHTIWPSVTNFACKPIWKGCVYSGSATLHRPKGGPQDSPIFGVSHTYFCNVWPTVIKLFLITQLAERKVFTGFITHLILEWAGWKWMCIWGKGRGATSVGCITCSYLSGMFVHIDGGPASDDLMWEVKGLATVVKS